MSETMNAPRTALAKIGSPLTEADYADLLRRWIDSDLADAAGIRRVDSQTGHALMGRADHARYDGLAIPYFLPGENRVREWRLRRDHPEIEYKDGRPKERTKYLSPPGRGNMIYFPPGLTPNILQNVSTPLVITEGEFKTLALWKLANENSAVPRFIPVGLGGVWNWRGTVGKAPGPNGERRDVKGVIPDIDLTPVEDRRVIVAFDADSQENEKVDAARTSLMREMRMRGAEVASIAWGIEQGKGIDDLLANIGPDKVLKLIEAADFEAPSDSDGISVHHLAEAITSRNHFARDAGGQLYVYRQGTYHSNGAEFVGREVKLLMNRLKLSFKWSSHKSEEVARYIIVDAPLLWEKPGIDVVNVLNGLLDVNKRELAFHTPEHLSPVQLPVMYDPKARCPRWDAFIAKVFPDDSEAIAWEIPAWLMTPDTSIQKVVLLTGDGANGKSSYLKALQSFIGSRNVASISLQRLEKDRFSVARLLGKLANICPDLPSEDLTGTSIFKAITGGDSLLAERKFKDSFEFTPFSRLVFAANHPPRSQDASSAFFRRWIVVPFGQIFRSGDPGTIPRDQLDKMLADPVELSGVLNKALPALATIRKNRGLTESESTCQALEEFRQTTDPLAVWLDRNTVIDPRAVVSCDLLCQEYNYSCAANGRPTVSKQSFGRALNQLRVTVKRQQRTLASGLTGCYVGIGLRTNDNESF